MRHMYGTYVCVIYAYVVYTKAKGFELGEWCRLWRVYVSV